jgi:cytochrome c oxidase accessory protein FixG
MSTTDQKVRLKIYERTSSLRADGHRAFVHPADAPGRFLTARRIGFAILIAIWAALPWVQIGGRPAVFLHVESRRFFLFGGSFDASSFWLVFFLLTGVLFSLVITTTMLGRVWCGWACPQTVFLEGVFRRIERLFEGNRNERMARDNAEMSFSKFWRRTSKHIAYIIAALLISHMFVAYFVSLPSLFQMMTRSPAEHPYAFAWCTVVAAILYGNFAWFREQLCLIVCPYGRMQSVLLDDDSLVVGYDEKRGEPRKKGKPVEGETRGDCIDCNRCVVVCPTGIDIRNGLQVDCIACTQCIDACDEVMDKVKKPRGLIRYDSLRGLRGEARKFIRPRFFFYLAIGAVLATVGITAFRTHTDVEARLLRVRGMPYIVADNFVRNTYELHLVNDSDEPRTFQVHSSLVNVEGEVLIGDGGGEQTLDIEPWTDRRVFVVVRIPADHFTAGQVRVDVQVGDEHVLREAPVLGPSARAHHEEHEEHEEREEH